jgi:hypothetical protein
VHHQDAVVLAHPIRADGERRGTLVLSARIPAGQQAAPIFGRRGLIIMLSLLVTVLAMMLQRVSALIWRSPK